jgi:glycosyltransferase, group 1 family
MKLVLVNTGINKSSAPYRLCEAINKKGIEAELLVAETELEETRIHKVKKTSWYRFFRKLDTLFFKVENKLLYQKRGKLPFSFYRIGMDISKEEVIQEADIVVLNWVCGNFISPYGIRKLIKKNKRIMLICHDNWHFTGGCHVRMGCERFMNECGNCPELHSKYKNDCSNRMFKLKRKCFSKGKMIIVSPSRWMDDNVKRSALLYDFPHYIIPNTLNTDLFRPIGKKLLREKYEISDDSLVLAFGAINAVSTSYKGYKELKEALLILEHNLKKNQQIEVIIFGDSKVQKNAGNFKVHFTGYLTQEEMVELYNSADIYIVPSLEDSFNYTVAESLACETPVVAFKTGGIVDIIDHKVNGYLADYRNVEDLAVGIQWVIDNNQNNYLGKHGRDKVIKYFSNDIVATKFIALCDNFLKSNGE